MRTKQYELASSKLSKVRAQTDRQIRLSTLPLTITISQSRKMHLCSATGRVALQLSFTDGELNDTFNVVHSRVTAVTRGFLAVTVTEYFYEASRY